MENLVAENTRLRAKLEFYMSNGAAADERMGELEEALALLREALRQAGNMLHAEGVETDFIDTALDKAKMPDPAT